MPSITLEIPEDIAAALRFPANRAGEELRREFAVFLVKEGILPRHKARRLAAMERTGHGGLGAHRRVSGPLVTAEIPESPPKVPHGDELDHDRGVTFRGCGVTHPEPDERDPRRCAAPHDR